MITVGSQPLHCGVVGETSLGEALSGVDSTDRSLDVDRIAPDRLDELSIQDQSWECLVIDCGQSTFDTVALVEQCTNNQSALPFVCLVEDWRDERVGNVVSAGRTTLLPRMLVESEPELLGRRIVSTVEKEYARTSFDELYVPCFAA